MMTNDILQQLSKEELINYITHQNDLIQKLSTLVVVKDQESRTLTQLYTSKVEEVQRLSDYHNSYLNLMKQEVEINTFNSVSAANEFISNNNLANEEIEQNASDI